MKDEKVVENAARLGEFLLKELQRLQKKYVCCVVHTSRSGCLLLFALVGTDTYIPPTVRHTRLVKCGVVV